MDAIKNSPAFGIAVKIPPPGDFVSKPLKKFNKAWVEAYGGLQEQTPQDVVLFRIKGKKVQITSFPDAAFIPQKSTLLWKMINRGRAVYRQAKGQPTGSVCLKIDDKLTPQRLKAITSKLQIEGGRDFLAQVERHTANERERDKVYDRLFGEKPLCPAVKRRKFNFVNLTLNGLV